MATSQLPPYSYTYFVYNDMECSSLPVTNVSKSECSQLFTVVTPNPGYIQSMICVVLLPVTPFTVCKPYNIVQIHVVHLDCET